MSSIGYDFLAFNRPMVLLTQSELTQAGSYLPPQQYPKLFEHCANKLQTPVPENTLYEETFDSQKHIRSFSSVLV